MQYAQTSRPMHLPPPAPTDPAIFSVPRPSGGYDYYRSPPGAVPAQNNDWPTPNNPHPNSIAVASIHVGRDLPPGSVMIGSGLQAIGSITAMPGAGGTITGVEALGAKGGFRPNAASGLGLGKGLGRALGAGNEDIGPIIQPDDLMTFSTPEAKVLGAVGFTIALLIAAYVIYDGEVNPPMHSNRGW